MFNNLRLAQGVVLKFCTSVPNVLKLKVRKFWRLISMFVEVTEEKLVEERERPFWPPSHPGQG